MARTPKVWKGKSLRAEFTSLITMCSLHMESGLGRFKRVALRFLPEPITAGGAARRVADIQRKEEMMQLAARIGATQTASRLTAALRAHHQEVSGEGQASSSSSALAWAPAAAPKASAPTYACAVFSGEGIVPIIMPVEAKKVRDQTDYEGSVMQQYNVSVMTVFPPGPLHLSLDGVQAATSGETNQYLALAPKREAACVKESCAWLPIQVKGMCRTIKVPGLARAFRGDRGVASSDHPSMATSSSNNSNSRPPKLIFAAIYYVCFILLYPISG